MQIYHQRNESFPKVSQGSLSIRAGYPGDPRTGSGLDDQRQHTDMFCPPISQPAGMNYSSNLYAAKEIGEALDAKNLDQAQSLVHNLKGTIRFLQTA